jgi:hypothetical protein
LAKQAKQTPKLGPQRTQNCLFSFSFSQYIHKRILFFIDILSSHFEPPLNILPFGLGLIEHYQLVGIFMNNITAPDLKNFNFQIFGKRVNIGRKNIFLLFHFDFHLIFPYQTY